MSGFCGIHVGTGAPCEDCAAAYRDIVAWPKIASPWSINPEMAMQRVNQHKLGTARAPEKIPLDTNAMGK